MIATTNSNLLYDQRVHELTEKLIDDRIEDAELSELKGMLASSAENRAAYIEAILLQVDLHCMGYDLQQRGRNSANNQC